MITTEQQWQTVSELYSEDNNSTESTATFLKMCKNLYPILHKSLWRETLTQTHRHVGFWRDFYEVCDKIRAPFYDTTYCRQRSGSRLFRRTFFLRLPLLLRILRRNLAPELLYRKKTSFYCDSWRPAVGSTQLSVSATADFTCLTLQLQRCSLYIFSTNIGTEYFKHGIYSPFFFLFKIQFVS